jgi:hypothetical protein
MYCAFLNFIWVNFGQALLYKSLIRVMYLQTILYKLGENPVNTLT